MPPSLDFVMELSVSVGQSQIVGETSRGLRRIVPILGGRFSGPRLAGTVLPGGADWQLIRSDGVAEIEARYVIQAEDGALISVVNAGYRHGPADVMARLAAGQPVDPSRYYFRTVPQFETASARHAWLGRTVHVGVGERHPDLVRIAVFAVG